MADYNFSRRTVLVAIEVLENFTQAGFTRFLHQIGAGYSRLVADENMSLTRRLNSFIELYDQDPHRRLDDRQLLADVIVLKAIERLPRPAPQWGGIDVVPELHPLQRTLSVDGFELNDGVLQRTFPEDIQLPLIQSELMGLLTENHFETPLGHLSQALDAHTRGDWASANGQTRTFLESLFNELAIRLDPEVAGVPGGHARRSVLARLGFFLRDLNEWDDQRNGFVNGLMRRLHPDGAHPGLSNEEDSTFRLFIVLPTARLFLRRFVNGSRQ